MSAPRAAMRSRASAELMIFTISVLSRATTSFGIAEGPSTPHHEVSSTPGKPDSASVGVSGAEGERCALATASMRTLPALAKL